MKTRWIVVLLLAVLMAVGGIQSAASYAPPAAPNPPVQVDEALHHILAQGQTSDLVIEFAEQADLSAAYGMDWASRGDYVVNALQRAAQRTQANATAYLKARGLAHDTFLVGNLLYVHGANLQVAEHLASLPGVARVRAPVTIYLDPVINEAPIVQATTAWGITDTKANQFWSTFGVQGDGIVVSNIDTGVQWDHPALVNAYKCQSNPSSAACWRDPSDICAGDNPCDNHGHGTHTMGTMVADDNPSLTYIAGMAPNAKWIACKGCESGSCSDFALNTCADWILAPGGSSANRPHVVNNSWGGGGGDTWYLGKVQAWRAAGIFPAFSAGNSGSSCSTIGSPGDYQESFASAAHSSSRVIASFSSRGPSTYGHTPYTKPNISAPGVSVCSSVPTNSWSCSWSGTSMASPHTAGAVALLWSCNSSLIGQIDQTFQLLQNNADTAPAGNCGAPPDAEGNYTYGYGYLNILAAGNSGCGGTPPPTPTPTPTPTPSPTIAQDNFESGGWSGGTGWNAAWTHSGYSDIYYGASYAHSGVYSLRLRGRTGIASRAVNLTGQTGVRLQFWWRARSFERGEYAQVFVNDGTNHLVLQINDGQDDNVYHYADISLSGYSMVSNFTIRFESHMSNTGDYLYVDDLVVTK